jgi:hypothetical protein
VVERDGSTAFDADLCPVKKRADVTGFGPDGCAFAPDPETEE